jgi:hypothetical protein
MIKKSPIKQNRKLNESEKVIVTPPPTTTTTGKKVKVEETTVNIKSEMINASRRSARGIVKVVMEDDCLTVGGLPLSVEHDDSAIIAPITFSSRGKKKKKIDMGNISMTASATKVVVVADVIDDAVEVVRRGSRKRR